MLKSASCNLKRKQEVTAKQKLCIKNKGELKNPVVYIVFSRRRKESSVARSHNMLYHGAQRVKLPNSSRILRLLSPLAMRCQTFQRYMISDVVFFSGRLTQFFDTLLLH